MSDIVPLFDCGGAATTAQMPRPCRRGLTLVGMVFACVAAGCSTAATSINDKPISRVEVNGPSALSPIEARAAFRREYASGMAFAEQGAFAEALGCFERALKHEPNSSPAMLAVGACHESIGDPIEAIRWYRRVLELDPLDADAYANLGTAYIKLFLAENSPGWRELAVACWRQALALNPGQAAAAEYLQRESRATQAAPLARADSSGDSPAP